MNTYIKRNPGLPHRVYVYTCVSIIMAFPLLEIWTSPTQVAVFPAPWAEEEEFIWDAAASIYTDTHAHIRLTIDHLSNSMAWLTMTCCVQLKYLFGKNYSSCVWMSMPAFIYPHAMFVCTVMLARPVRPCTCYTFNPPSIFYNRDVQSLPHCKRPTPHTWRHLLCIVSLSPHTHTHTLLWCWALVMFTV